VILIAIKLAKRPSEMWEASVCLLSWLL